MVEQISLVRLTPISGSIIERLSTDYGGLHGEVLGVGGFDFSQPLYFLLEAIRGLG